eukprot:TRINITY_DN57145_c0_g2_i1.p1 TRINITY_DN57145_c0_g2~~TRINITY_DN57145_c0_g2_i1.p1  ORF type:complete len:203 (-),score=-34.59 TRINITY_DN57145_c0_g2_i1:75-683(-)
MFSRRRSKNIICVSDVSLVLLLIFQMLNLFDFFLSFIILFILNSQKGYLLFRIFLIDVCRILIFRLLPQVNTSNFIVSFMIIKKTFIQSILYLSVTISICSLNKLVLFNFVCLIPTNRQINTSQISRGLTFFHCIRCQRSVVSIFQVSPLTGLYFQIRWTTIHFISLYPFYFLFDQSPRSLQPQQNPRCARIGGPRLLAAPS